MSDFKVGDYVWIVHNQPGHPHTVSSKPHKITKFVEFDGIHCSELPSYPPITSGGCTPPEHIFLSRIDAEAEAAKRNREVKNNE